MAHRHGCELLNTVSILGHAKPKKEDIALTEKRVEEQNGDRYKRTYKNKLAQEGSVTEK